jgi:hypothetical protein
MMLEVDLKTRISIERAKIIVMLGLVSEKPIIQ